MARKKSVSVYISFLLRHEPWAIGMDMDAHGWVSVQALIEGINRQGRYTLTLPELEQIVASDEKGRYRFDETRRRIKACQGHSIEWVEPELQWREPPPILYHGTTSIALEKIRASGSILKMARHAVHMQADPEKAWQSAERWGLVPVVLAIDTAQMNDDGFVFGLSDNGVWCTERVPFAYIREIKENRHD